MTDLSERTVRDAEFAKDGKNLWSDRWQRLADYQLPSMADFTVNVGDGNQRNNYIINSAGQLAAREFATRVNGFLTGEGTDWFDLKVSNPMIARDPAVKAWLDIVKRECYAVFNAPQSGFAAAMEPTYKQIGVFGNGPFFIGEGPNGKPRYRSEFLGNCSVWTDDDNRIIAVFREYKQTAYGLSQQFDESVLPENVTRALADEPMTKFDCIHAVRPRMDDDPFDIAGKPFIEIYVLKETNDELAVSGYWEFPWVWPRWNVTPTESYGRGPGDDAQPDVRMLQEIKRAVIKHAHKLADPPWMLDDEAGSSPRIDQNPGGKSYGRRDARGNWNAEPINPGGTTAPAQELMATTESQVESFYYLDAFKAVQKITDKGSVNHMSATEFAGRSAEQMQAAGPAVSRLRAEMLAPVIFRTAAILIRGGFVPLPPWQLRGAQVTPEYVSPLAIAQRSHPRNSILRLIGDITPLAQVDPTALDAINLERAVAEIAEADHVPQIILNTPAEREAIKKGRAEAAQRAAQSEQMVQASEASKNTAQALNLIGAS